MSIQKIKAAIRQRDGMRCTKCGMTNEHHLKKHGCSLHVHRLSPGSKYIPSGCTTLCFSCHAPEPKSKTGAYPFGPDYMPRLVFHLPQDLFDAFRDYVESLEPRPNDSAVLRLALERFLRGVGRWPRE